MAAGGKATSATLPVIQLGEHQKAGLGVGIPMLSQGHSLLMLRLSGRRLINGLGFRVGHSKWTYGIRGSLKGKNTAPRHLLLNVGPADGLAAPAGKDLLLLRSRPDKVHPPCAAQESNRWCGTGYYNTTRPRDNVMRRYCLSIVSFVILSAE